jgi:Ger(x)C family germination protein
MLAIIMGVGIDKTENPNEIEMTAQIARSGQMKAEKGGVGQGKAFVNVKAKGTDPLSIFREYTHQINRFPYTSHNQIIILGEDLAKGGIHDSLDFFLRSRETRMTVNILVARGKAKDVFDTEPELGKLPAAEIAQLIEIQTASSETVQFTLIEYLSRIVCQCAIVTPIVEVKKENGKNLAYISSGAVFKRDKMVGELNKRETRGLLWVLGKVKSGMISVPIDSKLAFIEVKEANVSVNYKIKKDGNFLFNIKINEKGVMSSQTGYSDLISPEQINALEKAEEKEIIAAVEETLKKAKELDADIFGFSDKIEKTDNKKWQSIKNDWDRLFKNVEVKVNVSAKIIGSGRLAKAVIPDKNPAD